MHSSMGLTKQVVSPRCILVWVRQSKMFLLDAFWNGQLALSNPYQNASRRNNLLCQTHTRMHRGETTSFFKPIPECIEEKQLALSNPYHNASRGLTKQVVSPRCILVWVWQSTSFLLDAFWYGFDKASCFSSMHSGMGLHKASCFSSMHSDMGLTKQVISPRCILVWA
jgi:hypothetical protein